MYNNQPTGVRHSKRSTNPAQNKTNKNKAHRKIQLAEGKTGKQKLDPLLKSHLFP